jgi:hypothetical protein
MPQTTAGRCSGSATKYENTVFSLPRSELSALTTAGCCSTEWVEMPG